MKLFLPALLLAFLIVISRSQTPAPPAGLTADEAARVLDEITKVQREFARTKKELLSNALERYEAGAAGDGQALEFFLACYRVVNLERKPAATKAEQEERANGEWQKKATASLGDGASSTVLRMQLQLLALMLEPATDEDADKTVAALRGYMQGVIAFLPSANTPEPPARRPVATVGRKGKRDDDQRAAEKERLRAKNGAAKLLRQSVMNTLFAEAYNLGAYMDAPAGWPQSPADFRAAYANVILPWYRASKKAELPAVWDEYLKGETTLQQISLTPEALAEWGDKEYKQLYWSKWLDLLNNGVNAATAAQELVKVIHENPSSPSLKTWIADLAKAAEAIGGQKFEGTAPAGAKP